MPLPQCRWSLISGLRVIASSFSSLSYALSVLISYMMSGRYELFCICHSAFIFVSRISQNVVNWFSINFDRKGFTLILGTGIDHVVFFPSRLSPWCFKAETEIACTRLRDRDQDLDTEEQDANVGVHHEHQDFKTTILDLSEPRQINRRSSYGQLWKNCEEMKINKL